MVKYPINKESEPKTKNFEPKQVHNEPLIRFLSQSTHKISQSGISKKYVR